MPDDINQKFHSFQEVRKPQPTITGSEITDEEYRQRVSEWKEKLSSQPGWRGKEVARRILSGWF